VTTVVERMRVASGERDVVSLGTDGVIGGGLTRDTTLLLTKKGVTRITLEVPNERLEGLSLDIVSSWAFPHVITAAGPLEDGTTGAKTTLTFADFVGASVRLEARQGRWIVLGTNAVTAT
jgi:hypothetical protein